MKTRALISDLEAGTLALRRETVGALARKLAEWGEAEVEAGRLSAFLETLGPAAPAAATSSLPP
ncbi:hypothetical protein [Chenggangzhangella methanolivorans]|uniref:Uncharacterized protein n=1 Tax=Chenggangzhangella methanolivorans TaxID=1437009 RepID=A0A9E6R5D2_9HYPH|nr:hypothetical protein [Chenggangzhangella methanolivorans]QZN98510.1 hypothetical protein K6K41_15800 [Chenggangzhangella methanolivorans]